MSRLLEKVAAFTNLVEDGFDVNDASILVKLAEEEDYSHDVNKKGVLAGALGGGALGTLAGYADGRRNGKKVARKWMGIRRRLSPVKAPRLHPDEIRKLLRRSTQKEMALLGGGGAAAGGVASVIGQAISSGRKREHEKAAALSNLLDNGYGFDDAVAIIESLS